ncbi:MAG: VWA domain-containing protein [Candidatus Pristimantibacillus lignocellulolyticus]|uniref:VWA domain-containing protein n=1 Tax=Candidatus Pristimantibacillus lignocellulolyticus TaxID=2994561 RepID=A0A9J6ZKC1_9BACL|nr:MAG: VWA domain-containing protein [Candidatus Pristimantibacillus lignocellulolyticus]
MYRKKINPLLILFSILGGVLGFISGEFILYWGEGQLHYIVLMGLYFGVLAFWVALLCLIAEMISPQLNGQYWRATNSGDGWKLLVPGSLVMLLLAGMLFQFIYGLYLGNSKPPQDIIIAIDNSESMLETDPNKLSITAIQQLFQGMETDKRVAILEFNDSVNVLQPLTAINQQSVRDEIIMNLQNMDAPYFGTDIGLALQEAMNQINEASQDGRKSMVILISDGYSPVELNTALAEYKDQNVAVNTIGMNMSLREGNDLLKAIASDTGGKFYEVSKAQSLSLVMDEIYRATQTWHLVGERTANTLDSLYYGLVRVISILLIGALMGLSLGIIYNNRYLAKSFMIGGAIGGLLAGLLLEFGIKSLLPDLLVRAFADIILALVLALSTAVIAYKQSNSDVSNGMYQSRNQQRNYQQMGGRPEQVYKELR